VSDDGNDALTPMLRQYRAVKSAHPGAILMFRMGDFYEMFYEDALAASRALDITLTARGKGTQNAAPMCGVPYHAAEHYVARLVRQGYRVALCDQVEEPSRTRKLIHREVVRVVTPGTVTDPSQLEARAPSYMGAILPAGEKVGLAFADLTTGDFRLIELPTVPPGTAGGELCETIEAFAPQEIIYPEEGSLPPLVPRGSVPPCLTPRPDWSFSVPVARRTLCEHLHVTSLAGYGAETQHAAIGAAGALLGYLQETQKSSLGHIDRIRLLDRSGGLLMDAATRRNLELIRSLSDGQMRGSLLGVIDRTVTAMGGRMLREWLIRPLAERGPIELRQQAVGALVASGSQRQQLRDLLRRIGDLERLLSRMSVGTGTPAELAALRASLEALPPVRDAAGDLRCPAIDTIVEGMEDLSDLAGLLRRALAEDPPSTAREGRLVRDGYDPQVDEARSLSRDGKDTLARLEVRERERTGISSLKVRYNRVFGYYIEVSKANLRNVPVDYERRQTLVGGERFVTPELKEYEAKVLTAQERLEEREYEIFLALRQEAVSRSSAIRRSAAAVASLDALASLAEAAAEDGWVRPEVNEGTRLRISAGRHPVVEKLMRQGPFVPNDLLLDTSGPQIAIVTGPNMGGKSTYLRQAALIVVLAQTGSFVPAAAAEIGVVDRLFSRIGASDNLAGGQSTFMVEMNETANILHSATPRSLVVLDEVGRGTSTFDGLSLAWAVVEHLHDVPAVAAKTLFATHYHELTDLALTLPRVTNLHIAAREFRGEVLFLHEVRQGSADQSYGIQVAKLAGVPNEVIERAREILKNLERNEFGPEGLPRLARRRDRPERQLPLFVPAGEALNAVEPASPAAAPPPAASHPALEALRKANPDRLTPLEALNLLAELKKLAATT